MPVRLSSTAVLAWPDAQLVAGAAWRWAEELRWAEAGVVAVGYFGSYARGDWGVGSDLDVVVIVDDWPEPFERRAARFDATGLPVPVDLLVYTRAEWGEAVRAAPRRGLGQLRSSTGHFRAAVLQDRLEARRSQSG